MLVRLAPRRLKLEFHGSNITSDAGLLTYRELDDALGLTEVAGTIFQDSRTGENGWHGMTAPFRQSVFGRLGGYEDVNDADRLGRDPAMRWIVGGKAVERQAASTSQMGRFETALLGRGGFTNHPTDQRSQNFGYGVALHPRSRDAYRQGYREFRPRIA